MLQVGTGNAVASAWGDTGHEHSRRVLVDSRGPYWTRRRMIAEAGRGLRYLGREEVHVTLDVARGQPLPAPPEIAHKSARKQNT